MVVTNNYGSGIWELEDFQGDGLTVDTCADRCKDYTKYLGFIHKQSNGRCFCEKYGGFAARTWSTGCVYDYTSDYDMYGWLYCIGGIDQYSILDSSTNNRHHSRPYEPMSNIYNMQKAYCQDDPARL